MKAIEPSAESPSDAPSLAKATLSNNNTHLLIFNGTIDDYPARIMFDTGATNSFISEAFVQQFDIPYRTVPTTTIHLAANDSKLSTSSEATNSLLDKSIGTMQ
jgi:hypothetical protein